MRAIACSLLVTVPLLALLPAAEPAGGVAARAAALAPLIGEETFALVRIDATKLDADAAVGFLKSSVPEAEDRFGDSVVVLKKFLSTFTAAGGTEAVVVFSTVDLPYVSSVFVPLKDGADEAALKRLLLQASGGGWRVEKRGQALVAGGAAVLRRIAQAKPSTRPELAAAVEAAGDGWLQALFLPTDDQRRVVDEVLPLIPGLEALPAKTLTQGVRWAALGAGAAPKPLQLTVQSADAAAAEKTAGLVRTGIAALGRWVIPGEEKPISELVLVPAEYKAATAALTAAVSGDRLTVTVSDSNAAKSVVALAAFTAERFESGASPAGAENIKKIVLALHNYHSSDHKTLPPNAVRSKDGKPLLSWRVAILPFLEQNALYKEFHLDEPWDSEHNKKLIDRIPAVYRSPRIRDKRPGLTTYLAPVGKEVAFTGEPVGRQLKEFTDGTSNTILLVDAADEKGVIWTKPDDLVVDLNDPKKGLLGHYSAYFLLGMADGSVRSAPKTISKATLRSAFTVAGGEVLGSDW